MSNRFFRKFRRLCGQNNERAVTFALLTAAQTGAAAAPTSESSTHDPKPQNFGADNSRLTYCVILIKKLTGSEVAV
jgi:hypothetical protein